MPDTSTQTHAVALKTKVRALVAAAHSDDPPAMNDHRVDLLLPLASMRADGSVRFDDGAERIAPKLLIPLTVGDSEEARLKRSLEIQRRIAPPPRGLKSSEEVKAAIKALGPLSPTASEETKLRRAADLTAILANMYPEGDPDGND